MIIGIGTDIVEVARFQEMEENARFLQRVYSPQEIEMFRQRKFNPQVLAGNFAAKEALLKAYGMGLGDIPMGKISVLRRESGQPYIVIDGPKKPSEDHVIHVSLSNIKTLAQAYVVVEKRDQKDQEELPCIK